MKYFGPKIGHNLALMSFDGPNQILPIFHLCYDGPKKLMSYDGPKSRFSPLKSHAF